MATEEQRGRPRSLVWQYFRKLNKSDAKCNFCGQLLKYQPNIYYLKSHISRVHLISSISDEEDKFGFWRFFTENENFTKATCKDCGSVIASRRNHHLQQHLQQCHSNVIDEICEEIKCTWVSQHFIVDMQKCDIKCIYCEYIFKIFVKIDRLKSHLFQCHKINENSRNHEEINDNNRNVMTQQSVTEENYASTSSHHNNRYEQDAGNQTVQQRDNTNMEHSSTSSEHDNHDTASATMEAWEMLLNILE